MEQLIQEMISITGGVLSEEKARQYLRFGKNDLGQALNYFYQAEERKQRQQPTAAAQKLLEGAKKQQKLEKIIKELKMEYEKPIEQCLDTRLPEKKQDVKLDFQPTNDIEEIAIQYANEKRASKVSEQKQQQQEQIMKKEEKVKQKKQDQKQQEPKQQIKDTEKIPQQIQVTNLQGFQFPLFIGSGQVKGYAVGNQNLQAAQQQPLRIILDATCKQTEKGKKSHKQQKGQNIIRIYHQNNEIGRLNTEFEDLLAPLLEANLIIVHGQHVYSQIFCKTHDTIFLKIDVLLNQKAVTDATQDLFDDSQQLFVRFKEHFQKLYDLLDCKMLVSTLVDVNRKKIETNLEIKENNSSNYTTKGHAVVTFSDNPFKQKPKQMSLDEFKLKQTNQQQIVEKVQIEEDQKEKEEDLDYDNLLSLKNCQHYDLDFHEPPEQLESELYNYQKQALTWLLQREGLLEQGKENTTRLMHPLWKEYQNVQGLKFYFNPFSGQTSLQFPSSSQRCNGGILADEMGLGKTVMFISLILANPFKIPANHNVTKQKQQSGKKLIADYVGYTKKKWAKTLIIVPVSLIQQWQDELIYHCKSDLKIYQYTGTDRNQFDLTQFDVIVSSYHTIGVEFKKSSRDPYSVYNYNWFRVILDEAHYIKGRTTNLAQAAYELDCYYRWCSTGTPIQNNLNDMFSLLHFIRLEPWSDYLWWNTYINKPHEEGQQEVFTLLNIILTPILLRRTKKSKDQNGDPIIQLPNKYMHFEKIELQPDEKLVYNKMETKSKDEVEGYLAKGILMSQYMKVFELLIRLRQICDHPLLITTRSDVKNIEQLEEQIDKFLSNQQLDREDQEELLINNQQIQVCVDKQLYKQEVLRRVKENDIPPCPICLEQVEDAVVTICLHFLCRLCLLGVLANKSECPYCRKFLTKQDTMTLPRESSFSLNWKDNYRRSSKIERVMKILSEIPENDKCVIFTQFIGMIQMIEFDLDRQGIKYLRLDGSMPQQKRADVLTLFKEENEYRVFIISLKAGGVGLNLTSANHVIMIDPWWNPAVEDQAIERVYRIGQNKEVHVYRLICNDTVEERMIQMHDVKKQLFESSVMTEEKKSTLRMEMFKNIILGK